MPSAYKAKAKAPRSTQLAAVQVYTYIFHVPRESDCRVAVTSFIESLPATGFTGPDECYYRATSQFTTILPQKSVIIHNSIQYKYFTGPDDCRYERLGSLHNHFTCPGAGVYSSHAYNSDQYSYFTGPDAGVYSSHVYNSDQYNYFTGPDAGV